MHEHHIVQSAVNECLALAEKQKNKKVKKVTLSFSEVSGFAEDSVRMYFNEMSEGTVLEGAELTIRVIPATLKCKQCGTSFKRAKGEFNCPKCGAMGFLEKEKQGIAVEKIDFV